VLFRSCPIFVINRLRISRESLLSSTIRIFFVISLNPALSYFCAGSLAQIVCDPSLYITPTPWRWDCVEPRWDVLLWSTFLEGTAKIHMLVLIPVKARNSIDVTSTRETAKTRVATAPSNSLKLSFIDEQTPSSLLLTLYWGPIEQRRCR